MLLDIVLYSYAAGIWGYLLWSPFFGGKAAYLIWQYRDTLTIETQEEMTWADSKATIDSIMKQDGQIEFPKTKVFNMRIQLPNSDYLEWVVSKDGVPGSNGHADDNSHLSLVFQKRATIVTELLRHKHSGPLGKLFNPVKDKAIHTWRMSFIVKWVIRKVSAEKLVLHKLSE